MSSKRKLTQFNLFIEIFKEGKFFIARAPLLDLAVQGKTEEETRKRFVDAVLIFFEELENMGTTNKVLYELGWVKTENQWRPPAISVVSQPIEVPIPV